MKKIFASFKFIFILTATTFTAFSLPLFAVNSLDETKPISVQMRHLIYKQTGGDWDLGMTFYYPANYSADKKLPAVIFFFGGSWAREEPMNFSWQSNYLARRGMIAIEAKYRTRNSDNADPTICLEDAKSAVRFIRANAEKFGINPEKIAVGGASAGGHLAAATFFIDGFEAKNEDLSVSSKPDALLLFNPVVDTSPNGFCPEWMAPFWRELSIVEAAEKCHNPPPTLVLNGDIDSFVPLEGIWRFSNAVKKNGGYCQTLVFAGKGHCFAEFRQKDGSRGVDYEQVMLRVDNFLTKFGFLEKPDMYVPMP